MPLITETYYLSLTQDNRGVLRLRCSQDDTLRTVNLKLYNNGSIFAIPSGVSASISGVKQNGAVFSKPCTISQDRESVVLQLSSDITNVDGIIVAEIVLNDGEGGRLGTSNFIIQVEKNPIRAGVVQDTETPIEYINDFIEKIQTLTARLNNLITPSGDASLAEVVDARIGILDSTTYQTLGVRLNAEFQRLSNALNGVTILESTGDTTNRTSEILSKLNAYGTCKLGKGDFYVNSLIMPDGSHLVGSGNSTRIILPSSVTDGYVVKPRSNCIIENISFYGGFTGTYSELIASGSAAQRHCIILDRFDSISSENVILSNIFINNFVGSAVLQRYTTGCHCKDVIINMCYAGIDISNASYDGRCVNVYINDTKFGVVQNGSNFVFSSCISKNSAQHIMSDQQNTECTFSSCTFFDSSLETTARLANLSNVRSGFVFDNCIFDSSLSMSLSACDGIVIKGTNFVGSDTFAITVSNGRNTLLLITDCIADVEPTVTNAGTAVRITSCYLKDGTAWTISEAKIIVDDELSDESENPIQNKAVASVINEINADIGDVTNTEYKLVGLKEGPKALGISFTRGKYRLMTPEANTLKTNSAYAISGSLLAGKRVGVVAITDDYEFAVIWYGNSISLEGRVGYTGWLNGGKFIDVPDGAYQFTYQVHKKDGTEVSEEDVDVIKNFVRFYVPLEINDVTDPTLSQEGKPADALSTGVELEKINTKLEKINTKFETNKLLIPFGFVRGNRTNGNSGEYINTEYISRATSSEKIHFDESVVFNINPGFRVRRYWFQDGSFVSFDGSWKTGSVMFKAGWEYYINISRIDEDTEETIDVDEFVSQVWRPIITGNLQPDYKVLAIGDSICKGARNGSKGFVGDLGYQYVNAGVDGATLSTVRDNTTHWIENQLTAQTDQFEIVLVEGGINDYFYGATLGTLSNKPIRKDVDTEAYAALDLNTTLGGLEHLFSTLINKYPNAHRFFVITHKTRNYPYTAGSGGFTQKELHDAIVSACELYGVSVIDIYEKSVINTYFSEYVSPTDWNSDNSVGETNWVDNDKVHPLAYGYLHGYIPLIQKALIECGYKWILS